MMDSSSPLPKPTEGELELLRVLWERGEATVREVFEDVSRERSVGYTSVLKQLQIMMEKGLVQRTETARAHSYRPSISREKTQNQMLRDLSDRLFAGSAAQLAMHALSMEPASAEDLAAVGKLLEKKGAK